MTKIQKQFKALLLTGALLLTTATVFYACKKTPPESGDVNENYSGEFKTYHESQDYKALVQLYPNSLFLDLPMQKLNNGMIAITTEIRSTSHENITAITYFLPDNNDQNIWFPTVVTRIKSDKQPLIQLEGDRRFTGLIEITTVSGGEKNITKVIDNEIAYENKVVYGLNGSINQSIGAKGKERLMFADNGGTGGGSCVDAAFACANSTIANMGVIAYAAYCIGFPGSYVNILADCLIHEKACLGVPKPSQMVS